MTHQRLFPPFWPPIHRLGLVALLYLDLQQQTLTYSFFFSMFYFQRRFLLSPELLLVFWFVHCVIDLDFWEEAVVLQRFQLKNEEARMIDCCVLHSPRILQFPILHLKQVVICTFSFTRMISNQMPGFDLEFCIANFFCDLQNEWCLQEENFFFQYWFFVFVNHFISYLHSTNMHSMHLMLLLVNFINFLSCFFSCIHESLLFLRWRSYHSYGSVLSQKLV